MTSTSTSTATAPALRTFHVDAAHSEVTFQVRHLLTKVRGRFSKFDGEIRFDVADPTRSSVIVTIQADSVDTSQPDRDTHLRTGDFFKVDEFPTLTFASERIVSKGGDAYDVTGALTIRGVTKPVTFAVDYLGVAKDPWGGERIAFEGEATINRKDFGVNWNAALETGGFLVGDEVRISLSIQAVAK
jgi:polyisoprenoid-binding protein YceI